MKTCFIKLEKVFVNYSPERGLISRIHKELKKKKMLYQKPKRINMKMDKLSELIFLQIMTTNKW